MTDYQELKRKLQEDVRRQMDMGREMTDEEIGEVIDQVILKKSRETYISSMNKLALRQELFNAIRRLDLLQELIDDREITEIMVNGSDTVFYEKGGRIYTWDKHFESKEKLEDVIQQIVSRSGRRVNASSPIVDASLSDGSRVNVVLDPVALNGPILTIRKFPDHHISMDQLIAWGSLTEEAAAYLKTLVVCGYNIFVSGATSSGKTTFLNVLADYIPRDARVITIEDTAELQLHDIDNLVRLEIRAAQGGENQYPTGNTTLAVSRRISEVGIRRNFFIRPPPPSLPGKGQRTAPPPGRTGKPPPPTAADSSDS